MIRCPTCDSTDTNLVTRLRFDDGNYADRRECDLCGAQWLVHVPAEAATELPADSGDDAGDAFEEREDGHADDDAGDDVENWFR